MPRLIRIGSSFLIVLAAYWVYAIAAVPIIEPPADPKAKDSISEEDFASGQSARGNRLKDLQGMFPPGDWRLDSPKILENDEVKLLFQKYTNLGDGKVKISPCTIIFTPPSENSRGPKSKRRRIILDAPDGALLQFDEPFNLSRAKVGRLRSGELAGRITIHSQGKLPGPEDDLSIVTREVKLTQERIWTSHAVDFRLGPNFGRGEGMLIKLLPDEDGRGGKKHGPNVGSLESFELRKLDRLHLEFAGRKAASDKKAKKSSAGKAMSREWPIEITCGGPFRFNLSERLATFEDGVDVLRINPDGPSDQLNCQRLSVHFARRRRVDHARTGLPQVAPDGERSGALDLEPSRIVAHGNPVVVRSPSQGVQARSQQLEYDLASRRILLDDDREVFLKQGPNEIHAHKLDYQPGESGRLGRLSAEGPGWLRGEMADRPQQPVEVRWNEQLKILPDGQYHVISLTGGAELSFSVFGRLAAGEIYFWVSESPPAAKTGGDRFQPDRMLARRDVQLGSHRLSGEVEQLEVWFEQAPQAQGETAENASARNKEPAANGAADRRTQPPDRRTPALSSQHFEIVGNLLRVRLTRGEQMGLSELLIEDNVRLTETRTARPDEEPLLVSGDWIHVVDADSPHAAVTVTGQPAYFQGRGLGLTGSNINLDQGTNRLWIEGPGRMDLPMDRDLDGRPIQDAGPLVIRWQNRMEFDGRTARFEKSVVAKARHQHLETETLEVGFKQPIRFADRNTQSDPQPEQIRCLGSTFMKNHSFDGQELASIMQIRVSDPTINLTSGELAAVGPGWVKTVYRGSPDVLPARPGSPATAARSSAADSDSDGLSYLHVQFQESITGNLHRRTMSFHRQVRTVYGPVDSWEDTLEIDNPDALGPRGALLSCDRLSVTEMETPLDKRRTMELETVGNTRVEGQTYAARANRMTYSQAKDLLILEGNGRADAELFRQQHVGGTTSTVSARKIHYRPGTNTLDVDGVRSAELNQLRVSPRSQDQ